jgi:hypothetical protein
MVNWAICEVCRWYAAVVTAAQQARVAVVLSQSSIVATGDTVMIGNLVSKR